MACRLSCGGFAHMRLKKASAFRTCVRSVAYSANSIPTQHFINNTWRDAVSGKTLPVENPHTGEVIVNFAAADADDVNLAVQAAYDAQWSSKWGRATTGAYRAEFLRSMASTLRAQAEGWAEIETDDCGKPIIESRADIAGCVELLEYYAGLAEELGSPGVEAQSDGLIGRVHREPAGVVAAISPWNFPLWQSVAKVAPAIAAGCAVVLKPSERAPLTSLKLGELALEAGLPSGVLNILGGEGFVAGPPLCRHPLVDRVSYTGSGIVGKSIMQIAAERLQFSTMELGGKSSMIVFDDCPDIDAVVDWIMLGIFMCAGQVCSATSRLLVHESIKQAILDKVTAKTRLIRIGDPRLESTNMGPMASKLQRNRVVSYIEGAVKDGIPLIIGGPEPPEGVPADGAFVRPTIFADVPTEAKIWKEEIFGPVLAVRSFSTEEEAVSLANDTEYGLAGAVFTQDQARCERVTARLRCGYVWQNANGATMPGMPFGGFKQSGFGKECGREGLDAYLQSKSVVSAAPGFSWGWYN